MDRPTVAVYDAAAEAWRARREVRRAAAAQALARNAAAAGGGPVVDLGCGPGWQLPMLGAAAVGLDASRGMVGLARAEYPDVALVRADLEALPFRTGSLGGAWASRSYIHVERCALPLALADLHRALAPDAAVELTLFEGDSDLAAFPDDDFTGRRFAGWTPEALTDVVGGAGFRADVRTEERQLVVSGVRARTLPDFVAPNLRLLTCGLNPSLHAADAGYGYAGPSNRFWTAVVEAGLVRHPRQPRRMVVEDGVGMTCLVKRATARADELSAAEYRAGVARVERLVRWLQPAVICFVGLAGYRAAVNRAARPGLQPEPFAGRPAYVLPSTSGLNAATPLASLVEHFRAAAKLAAQRSDHGNGDAV